MVRWHEGNNSKKLFLFYVVILFLPVQTLILFTKPFIIWFVGIGPGDVSYHPLNIGGSVSLTYICLVIALVSIPIRNKNKLSLISIALGSIAAVKVLVLYLTLISSVIGSLKITLVQLVLTYTASVFVTYLFTMGFYLAASSIINKKFFKIQDMLVLSIAFVALVAKILTTQGVTTSGIENIWLLLASIALGVQLSKLTWEFFQIED